MVGAIRSVAVDISCGVDSDPPVRLFRWKFNNSGETVEVSPDRYVVSSNGTTSVLRYTAYNDHDYGTLMCWAENSVGVQAEPCVITIISASE